MQRRRIEAPFDLRQGTACRDHGRQWCREKCPARHDGATYCC
jgi:hypothetical protein